MTPPSAIQKQKKSMGIRRVTVTSSTPFLTFKVKLTMRGHIRARQNDSISSYPILLIGNKVVFIKIQNTCLCLFPKLFTKLSDSMPDTRTDLPQGRGCIRCLGPRWPLFLYWCREFWRCKSRQEAGNIMMVPVMSEACRQFKMKNTLFSCALACKCVRWGFNLQTCFMIFQWHTKLLSIRLELFILPSLFWGCLQFFQKETNDSYRFISELMDVFFMAGGHQQPEQSNYLAKGQTY